MFYRTYYSLLSDFLILWLFQKAAKTYGVPDTEVFQTPDLFEARNVPQVQTMFLVKLSIDIILYRSIFITNGHITKILLFIFSRWRYAFTLWQERLRNTQSMMDQPWGRKWPQKINEISQKKIFEKEEMGK